MLSKIEIIGNGAQSKVIVNGTDVSNYVSKVEYTHKGGEVAEVKLTLIPDYVSINNTVAHTNLLDVIADALADKANKAIDSATSSDIVQLRKIAEQSADMKFSKRRKPNE